MNLLEAKKILSEHKIYQLNRGETLADALDHVQNGTARKGYKVRADNGRALSENEIIMHENSVAFHRFTPSAFQSDEVEEIDDIPEDCDFRDDKTERGEIINCFYCGTCLRVDESGEGDYAAPVDTIHCEGCMKDATSRLAM